MLVTKQAIPRETTGSSTTSERESTRGSLINATLRKVAAAEMKLGPSTIWIDGVRFDLNVCSDIHMKCLAWLALPLEPWARATRQTGSRLSGTIPEN